MRSRTGCWTCREDGYKCDEEKPSCGRCVRLKKTCKGYGIRLRWREATSSNYRVSAQTKKKPSSQLEYRPYITRIPDVRLGDEKLLHHWRTAFAQLISISVSTHNPFLVHLNPLLEHSGALRSVITSMAANHLAQIQPESNWAVVAIQHRIRAVAYLQKNIATSHPETSLATVILLQLADRLFMEDSGVNHLQGAKAIILHRGGQGAWSSSRGKFLLALCWYHDVLSSVSKSQAPLLGLENVLVEGLFDSVKLRTILALVGQISSLRSGEGKNNAVEEQRILSALIALEETEPADDTSRNSEVFRQSALIYFYRTTKASDYYPSLHSRLCLQHLSLIPPSSPFASSHIWPLWTAGCEVTDEKLRGFVLHRLDEMYQARHLTYLQRLKHDVLDVWHMKDLRRGESGKDDIDCVNAILNVRHRDVDIV
ncbi:fungal-specific transcription factor domain-containing protein [Aspergillus floccosus]